jgi:hypothetical protein
VGTEKVGAVLFLDEFLHCAANGLGQNHVLQCASGNDFKERSASGLGRCPFGRRRDPLGQREDLRQLIGDDVVLLAALVGDHRFERAADA